MTGPNGCVGPIPKHSPAEAGVRFPISAKAGVEPGVVPQSLRISQPHQLGLAERVADWIVFRNVAFRFNSSIFTVLAKIYLFNGVSIGFAMFRVVART